PRHRGAPGRADGPDIDPGAPRRGSRGADPGTADVRRGRRRRGSIRMKRARAEILSTRTIGAYRSITLVAPEIAERSRPGQFLAIAMPEGRAFILRRHFSINQASRGGGEDRTLALVGG